MGSRLRILVGLCAALLAGCGSDLIEPEFDVMGKTMVVVPFKSWDADYFDSEPGIAIAKAITLNVKLNADAEELKMIDIRVLEKLDEEQDIRKLSWHDLASEVGADYVCYGEILDLQTRLSTDVALLRGKLLCELTVIDTTRDDRVVFNENEEFLFPDVRTNEFTGYSVIGKTEEDIERGLVSHAGWRLALNFYSHFPEDAKKRIR